MGGIIPFCMAMMHTQASSAPPAPNRWPVIDFVELIGTRLASSPRASLMALVSLGTM